ncbi:MAG: acyltransferase domain-containing protein, partial [Candidatus Latescibacterota bacterium]
MRADEEDSQIRDTEVAQVTNFALQVALTEFLKSWGIVPDAVVGHSVGEVASVYAAGALSLEDAMQVCYQRSRLLKKMAGQGTMLAIALSREEAEALLEDYSNVSLAAINSPSAVTLSGERESLEGIAAELEAHDIFNRFLKVEVAYHSYQMESIRGDLLRTLAKIQAQKTAIPIYSTVTGSRLDGDAFGVDYWWKNVREPVDFYKTMQTILADDSAVILEVGPHPVLSNAIKECMSSDGKQVRLVSTLDRKKPEWPKMFECISQLYTLGYALNWENNFTGHEKFMKIPTYAWQRETFWLETKRSQEERYGCEGHVFLNNNLRLPHSTWEVELNQYFLPYLKDHQVENTIVFPGAAYVEAGIALHEKTFGQTACSLDNVKFHHMLIVEESNLQRLYLSHNHQDYSFEVWSRTVGDQPNWMQHATGNIHSNIAPQTRSSVSLSDLRENCPETMSNAELYDLLKERGLRYGEYFRPIKRIWKGPQKVLAEIQGHPSLAENHDGYHLHPTILDAGFQSLMAILDAGEEDSRTPFIPVEIDQIHYYRSPGNTCWSYGEVYRVESNYIKGNIEIYTEAGELAVGLHGVTCQAIVQNNVLSADTTNNSLYDFQWKPVEYIAGPAEDAAKETWLAFADQSQLSQSIIEIINRRNTRLFLVERGDRLNQLNDSHFSLSPRQPNDMRELFARLPNRKITKILYLWGAQERPGDSFSEMKIEPFLDHCVVISNLVRELATSGETEVQIGMATRGTQIILPSDKGNDLMAAGLWGLGHLIGNEHSHISCKLIDLSARPEPGEADCIIRELLANNQDEDIAYRNGDRYLKQVQAYHPALEHEEQVQLVSVDQPVELIQTQMGNMESMTYQPIRLDDLKPHEIRIRTHYAPLNFKDLLKVRNQIAASMLEDTYFGNTLGMECSGTVVEIGSEVINFQPGDEVIAILNGGFKSWVTAPDTRYVYKKPSTLSLKEIPLMVPFFTAYYSLVRLANLHPGEKVLIHNAAGAVGLSAIQVAQKMGAEIYATVGNEQKREYLADLGV